MPLGYNSVKYHVRCTIIFVGCKILGFASSFDWKSLCQIQFLQDIIIENIRLSALSPSISSLKNSNY